MIAILGVVALLGLAIGSFLNVVIWRVPRGESVSRPPSACPQCHARIRPIDNIPVISWLVLRGRCRSCGLPISWRYPAVELATAVMFVLIALRFGFAPPGVLVLPAYLYLAALAIALSLIDIDTHRLPNAIVLPSYVVAGALLGAAALASGDFAALVRAVIGGAVCFGFYLILVLVYPKGMGFGDVKLAGVLGLYLGWIGWGALAVGGFTPFLLGGVFAVALLITGKARWGAGIPFGPWMLAGTMIGVFAGTQIADGYLAVVGII